jgi:hypothetical protein
MTAVAPRPRTAQRPTVTAADHAIHRTACQQPTTATTWSDRCSCRHVRGRHDAARHQPITTTTTAGTTTCTGRSLAGTCLWPDCPCTGFTADISSPNRGRHVRRQR